MCFVHYISVINGRLDFDKVRYSLRNVIHYSLLRHAAPVELYHNGISYVKNSEQVQGHKGFLVLYLLECELSLSWKPNVTAAFDLCDTEGGHRISIYLSVFGSFQDVQLNHTACDTVHSKLESPTETQANLPA